MDNDQEPASESEFEIVETFDRSNRGQISEDTTDRINETKTHDSVDSKRDRHEPLEDVNNIATNSSEPPNAANSSSRLPLRLPTSSHAPKIWTVVWPEGGPRSRLYLSVICIIAGGILAVCIVVVQGFVIPSVATFRRNLRDYERGYNYQQYRINYDHKVSSMYKGQNPNPLHKEYPYISSSSLPEENWENMIPSKFIASHEIIGPALYEHVSASAQCITAFEGIFTQLPREGCNIPWKELLVGKIPEDPLYVWNGRDPLSKYCRDKLYDQTQKVWRACKDNDVTFPGTITNPGTISRLDGIATEMLYSRHWWNNREAASEVTNLAKESFRLKNFYEAAKGNLRKLGDSDINIPVREVEPLVECTTLAKRILKSMIYYEKSNSEADRDFERIEKFFLRISHAYDLCPDGFLRWLRGRVPQWYTRDWHESKSGGIGELLQLGMAPNDFPLKELGAALKGANNTVGIDTYHALLMTPKSCYPFLSGEDIENYLQSNPLLQTAYCDLSCSDGIPSDLIIAIDRDLNREGNDDSLSIDQGVRDVISQMRNRISIRRSYCGSKAVGQTTNWPELPMPHEYVNKTLLQIDRMLDADPNLALGLYEQQPNILETEQRTLDAAAEASKKYIICDPRVRGWVAFTIEPNPFYSNQLWWERYRLAYPSYEILSDLMKVARDIAKKYGEYCDSEMPPHAWPREWIWRKLTEERYRYGDECMKKPDISLVPYVLRQDEVGNWVKIPRASMVPAKLA